MISQIVRKKKYEAKLDGSVAKDRAVRYGPEQRSGFRVAVGDQVGIERLTKSVLTASGVMPGLNHFYMNFAKTLARLKSKYSGNTLVTEVCALYEHWRLRGLVDTILNEIIVRLGLSSCVAPPVVCAWDWKRKLTFSGNVSATNLDNFPVLVHLTVANFDFAKAKLNGEDIRFMDADQCPSDGTPLKHEIEYWNQAASEAFVWVKVPRINGGTVNDFIYMFYGNAAAADGQDAVNVWDANYKFVLHLRGDGTTNLPDSTTVFTATKIGIGQPANVHLNIDGSQDFDGLNDDVSVNWSYSGWAASQNFTMSCWFKADYDNPPANQYFLCPGPVAQDLSAYVTTGGILRVRIAGGVEGASNADVCDGNWHHFTWGYRAGATFFEVDGADQAIKPIISTWTRGDVWHLGNADGTSLFFDGKLDEHRLSDIGRTSDYRIASYRSEAELLITYGAEQPA